MSVDYKSSGVDIAAGNEVVARIKKEVAATFTPSVLTGIGSFGSLFDLTPITKSYQQPVMVQSIDGVGTKTIVARMMNRYDTIGMDLVSATANDIVVLGAKPLTLLDYVACDRLKPEVVTTIVSGMAKACQAAGIALVGGETAEMPNTYLPGEHDLVGIVTGVVEKDRIITGQSIRPGDQVLAFASSGLHTNGYSLARKCFFDVAKHSVETHLDELGQTVGEALLTPHINYTRPVHDLLEKNITIKGMAHITGGGVIENIPRILPDDCAVTIRKDSWPILPVFTVLQSIGNIAQHEMYRTFNMGVGLVMIVDANDVDAITKASTLPMYHIGEVSNNQSVSKEERVNIC
ncbi:MAG: phosphoribosylformylglycinamidine cyclo-ligase [Gammaproteobacteria bacterium]